MIDYIKLSAVFCNLLDAVRNRRHGVVGKRTKIIFVGFGYRRIEEDCPDSGKKIFIDNNLI